MAPKGWRSGSTGEGEPRPESSRAGLGPGDVEGPESPEHPLDSPPGTVSGLSATGSRVPGQWGPTDEGPETSAWSPADDVQGVGEYGPESGWAGPDEEEPVPGTLYEASGYEPAWAGEYTGFGYQGTDYEEGPYEEGPYEEAGYGTPAFEAPVASRFSESPLPGALYGPYPGTTAGAAAARRGRQKEARPARRRSRSGPWPELVMVTAVAVILAAVALAVTSANRSKVTSTPPSPTLAAGAKAKHPGASTGGSGKQLATSSPTSGGTPTTSAQTSTTRQATSTTILAADNLVISSATKESLVGTWIATNPNGLGLTTKDVAGTVPGEVFYGYDISISTYFAIAAFQPSASLLKSAKTGPGQAELAAFQDNEYVFSLQTGSAWTLLGDVPTGSCPGEWVPKPVLTVWGMCGLNPHAA